MLRDGWFWLPMPQASQQLQDSLYEMHHIVSLQLADFELSPSSSESGGTDVVSIVRSTRKITVFNEAIVSPLEMASVNEVVEDQTGVLVFSRG